jgi:hypothetical protein
MRISFVLASLLVTACGDGGGLESVPAGTWRLVGETVNGTATPAANLNGALQLGATDYALGIARPGIEGVVTSYTLEGSAFVLSGAGRVEAELAGNQLKLRPTPSRELTFELVSPQPADTLSVTGTVTLAAGAPSTDLHVTLVRRKREPPGFFFDERDDRALTFTGDSAAFDLSRDRGALGTDRIPFPPGTSVAIGLLHVVVYEDRDMDGELDELATCGATTVDCVRGISPYVVADRAGSSPELEASSYALLQEGWCHAVTVTDERHHRPTVASVDPQATIAHAITVAADPSTVVIPSYDLTLPAP